MKIFNFLIALCILLFILVSIYFTINYNYSNELPINNTTNDDNYNERGYGLRVYDIDGKKLDFNQYINNSTYQYNIDIINNNARLNQFLIIAMLDYNVTPIYIDGSEYTKYLVNISKFNKSTIRVNMTNISKGNHDMIILVFIKPYEHSLEPKYRYSTDFSLLLGDRYNLIYSDISDCNNKINIWLNKRYDTSYPLDGLLVNKQPFSNNAWLVENTTSSSNLSYFINIGNKNTKERKFAVVEFLDYEQIPINYETNEYCIYGRLGIGEACAIESKIITPKEVGTHELVAVWISNPYENMDTVDHNESLENYIEPSIRIGINIDDYK